MAIQILNDPLRSLGSSIGSSIGAGLGSGLQQLAQQKLDQFSQRQQIERGSQFWQGLGLPKELAVQFAQAPESVQKSLLDRLEGVNIGGDDSGAMGEGATKGGFKIGANPAERRHKELLAQKEQHHLEKLHTPALKQIEEEGIPARQTLKLVDDIEKVVGTSKAVTGVAGKFLPNFLQTPEGQELNSLFNQLVVLKAQLGKGVPSKLRLQLEELSKPAIWQDPSAIKKQLNRIKNDPEIQRYVAKDQAREELLGEFEGKVPRDLPSLIDKRSKEIISEKNKSQKSRVVEGGDSSYPDGAQAKNPKTGKIDLVTKNGKWVKV